jgi:hypothetical protein
VADRDSVRRRSGLGIAWLVAAVVAVIVGVTAVTRLGDQLSDRGPLGNQELIRKAEPAAPARPDPDDPLIEGTFEDDFGSFVVACQGKFAIGVEARPDEGAGWRTISYEPGPDDDIDAVFSNGRRSQELEIYCNLGRPVLSELENNTIPDDD